MAPKGLAGGGDAAAPQNQIDQLRQVPEVDEVILSSPAINGSVEPSSSGRFAPVFNPATGQQAKEVVLADAGADKATVRALAEAGVKCVIAEFYARIFFRNSVNGGYVMV